MAREKSIRLSEKYGVNPSMVTCFYCGEVTSIALMGKLPHDEEAPRQCCMSVEPCDKCKEKYKDYLLVVEKPMEGNPTGRWFAMKKEAVAPEFRANPVAFMLEDEFQQIVSQMEGDE